MKLTHILLTLIILILYVGIIPREIQHGAPSIFMLGGVVLFIITQKLITKLWKIYNQIN